MNMAKQFCVCPRSQQICRLGIFYLDNPTTMRTSNFSGLLICSSVSRANRSFFAQKWALIFGERTERFAHDRSFPLSNVSELLMVAHFWWATWAICSHRSFLVSDLSDLLTSLRGNERLWANCLHRSPKKGNEGKWAIRSFFNNFFFYRI